MRIDSLLNDHTGVVAPHHSANPGSLEQHRPAHTTAIIKDPFTNRHSGAISSSAVLPASSSDPPPPPSSSLQNHYSPYQQGTNLYREHTAPSRVTYSGPPACSLAAAVTGSPEPSIPRHSKKNTTWFEGKTGIMHSNTGSTFPGREQHQQQKQVSNLSPQFLPPFTDFVSNMQQPTSTVGVATESAVSPRPSHRQQHLSNHQAGYSSYPAQYQQKSYYQQKYLPPAVNDGSTDNLMRFADVACMESATLGGRRCLDDVAAAEVLSGRQGSMVAEGSDNSLVRITASVNIDPALRPEISSDRSSSTATQGPDDAPLFRSSPEPATPPAAETLSSAVMDAVSVHEFLSEEPKCSYCPVCTTESPLRKVVSHIFGRNKLSTRQIPKNVWVYFCRKHYQRSRYRNPRGFANQQISLVRRQCKRLEQWGGVKQWVIKVRRREEIRMNKAGDNADDDEMEEVGDDEVVDDELLDGPEMFDGGGGRRASVRRRSSAGASNWIMKHTGPERTIQDVYRLLDKIEVEVQQNGGKFPDVELLPNVDLALAVTNGMDKKIPDELSDDGKCEATAREREPSGSPRSKKRTRSSPPSDSSSNPNKRPKPSETTTTKRKPKDPTNLTTPRTTFPGRPPLSQYPHPPDHHHHTYSPPTSASSGSRRPSWELDAPVRSTPFSNHQLNVYFQQPTAGQPRPSRSLPPPQPHDQYHLTRSPPPHRFSLRKHSGSIINSPDVGGQVFGISTSLRRSERGGGRGNSELECIAVANPA